MILVSHPASISPGMSRVMPLIDKELLISGSPAG